MKYIIIRAVFKSARGTFSLGKIALQGCRTGEEVETASCSTRHEQCYSTVAPSLQHSAAQ